MENLRIAMWSTDFSYPLDSLGDWVDILWSKAREAKEKGAQILLLPEYACEHWLSFADHLPTAQELEWIDSLREEAIGQVTEIARELQMVIIPGTFPVKAERPWPTPLIRQPNDTRGEEAERFFNRAYVVGEDGVIATQDKLTLTPFELDEQDWNIQAGTTLDTFEVAGATCAILICLDVEQPLIAQEIYKKGVDVLFVPSMTMWPSGHARVFGCARARAIEGVMAVAAVGAVGVPQKLVGRETNYSGAALFGPCEMDMAQDGIMAELEPSYGMSMVSSGSLLLADVPVTRLQQKREGQPEAWPGILSFNKPHP